MPSVKSYEQAATFLGAKSRRKLENNTYLERQSDRIVVRLHETAVVVYQPDKITLYSGGYLTRTTKDRLCKYGRPVWQRKGEWYCANAVGTEQPFSEGVTFYPNIDD